MYQFYNPNPSHLHVGDCSIRAIAKALDTDWKSAYIMVVLEGYIMNDMPSSDSVWGSVLRANGFSKSIIPNTCPNCYCAEDFCRDHPSGTFVLAFGGHVATVQDGVLYDSWNSSQQIPIYYYFKEEDK